MSQIFYAKSKLNNGTQPTVKEHLDRVAELSAQYGAELGLEKESRLAGQLHDFGKYSKSFQNVLAKREHGIDHAVCGAVFLDNMIPSSKKRPYTPIIEAISGHHDGLFAYESLQGTLENNWKCDGPVESSARKTIALSGKKEYLTAVKQFKQENASFAPPRLKRFLPPDIGNIPSMLYTRMLLSCLVDADYSVSASDENPDYFSRSEQTDFSPEQVLQELYRYRDEIRANSSSDSGLNRLRDELFQRCGDAGEGEEGLFTLTAPTGTGKTLALLHFALRHCIATGKKRIIVVLPYLSLTEQTVTTYGQLYPDVIEDHSQSKLPDEQREYTSRWSVPVIVTTSVKFFETLFAHKPTDCRKLHNIANSVVIFDEAQSLPAELTSVTLQAVNELCQRYHTTMVFSTATQPDFSAIPHMEWTPREILPDNARFYQALHRTDVHWQTDEPLSLDELAEEMAQQDSVCAIVNMRKHANRLYERLAEQCPEDEVFYLTTNLCGLHRRKVIEVINRRLRNHQPCRVIATQCIEAGVDFDFDVLYRALAPLEAVIQAAGRCNRNGRLAEGGQVTVFVPELLDEESLYPSNWYGLAAQIVKDRLMDGEIDIENPQHIRSYYRELFREINDKKALNEAIECRNFAETDKEYELIENHGVRVIVPYGKSAEEYDWLYRQLRDKGITPKNIKDCAAVTVTASFKQQRILEENAEHLNYQKRGRRSDQPSEFYILHPQSAKAYREDVGLHLIEEAFNPFADEGF